MEEQPHHAAADRAADHVRAMGSGPSHAPLDDDARMDDVRAEIRSLLIDAVNDVAKAEFGGNLYATAAVEELANVYVRLGGDLELPNKSLDAYYELVEQYEALDKAVGLVCAAAADLAADDFPPRLQALIDPLNRLAEQAGR